MSKITSIATGVPEHKHGQDALFSFADAVYSKDDTDSRKLKFLYRQSGIENRYSVLKDYTAAVEARSFYTPDGKFDLVPDVQKRMELYNEAAIPLSEKVILDCIKGRIHKEEITHLITVSCTGMSAPGLDLLLTEQMNLPVNIMRTSVNFMGCYAAIHALKIADAFCKTSPAANVVIVCTELCTLHFQTAPTTDNLTSSLLFGDGCAAMLVQPDDAGKGLQLQHFFSEVSFKGRNDMAWKVSASGFLMTLSGYIPELIKADFKNLVDKALAAQNKTQQDITHWCIHPGGKKILDAIAESISLQKEELNYAYEVLRDYGNMSSPTVVFVLQKILNELHAQSNTGQTVFGAAFGPGLTMETFTAVYD